MNTVILLGAHVNALGIIRALANKDLEIIVMYYKKYDIAQVSKFVDKKFKIPDPNVNEKEFIRFLVRKSKRLQSALLIPTNDETAVVTSKYKELLSKYYIVSTADCNNIRTFINKKKTYALCEELNIPYPKTVKVGSIEELEKIRDMISFPCLIRPEISHTFATDFNKKLFEVSNYSELNEKCLLCFKKGHPILIQEFIHGDATNLHENIYYYNSKGECVAEFFMQKIRQYPQKFGVCSVVRCHPRITEIDFYSKKLLKYINYRGAVHVEYKKDPKDGKYKLLEVNPRFIRANWLHTYCGVNIPYILYNDLVEKKDIRPKTVINNVYWIEIYADIINSIIRDRKGFRALNEYISSYRKDKTFAVLVKDDLKPFLYQFLILLFKYLRMVSTIIVRVKNNART